MLGPHFIIVAGFLFSLEPSRFILPAGDKIYTPYHNEKGINKIAWTIVCRVFEKVVKKGCEKTNNCRKNKPFLQKPNKLKVNFIIGADVVLYAFEDDWRISGVFVNGQKLIEKLMLHDVNKGKFIEILLTLRILNPFAISQQEIVLAPELFFGSKQRAIDWRIGINFMLVKHTVPFLFHYLLISRQFSCRYVTKIVSIVIAIVISRLLDALVNVLLSILQNCERFLVLDFQYSQIMRLVDSDVFVHTDQYQKLVFLLVLDKTESDVLFALKI